MRETPKTRWKLALLSLAALASGACTPREVRPGEYRAWVNGFAFGLLGSRSLDVRDVCPSGAARGVAVEQTAVTVVLTAVSVGLYSPRQVRIRCRP